MSEESEAKLQAQFSEAQAQFCKKVSEILSELPVMLSLLDLVAEYREKAKQFPPAEGNMLLLAAADIEKIVRTWTI